MKITSRQYIIFVVACVVSCCFTLTRHLVSPILLDKSQAKKSSTNTHSVRGSLQSSQPIPAITEDDKIYNTRSAFVIPEYKLIFFTFPKVACSEWKRMFMRINGHPDWCMNKEIDVHNPDINEIQMLSDLDPEIATAIMISPAWTRAAIFREPKERVLSAFLDKTSNDHYSKKCCAKLPNKNLQRQCKQNQRKFESFLYFVTEYPEECFNVHWEPQINKIDSKWWPYIDIVGYQHNLKDDSKLILSQLTSSRHNGDDNTEEEVHTAWDRYGVSGWGPSDECENRPYSFLEKNYSNHNYDAGSQMKEWYTAETEKLVEEKWEVEWSNEKVKFPIVKLF